jgi:hypothetical protein
MAVIHHTTLTPTKLELLTGWLPAQPWYVGTGRAPELTRVGGFRLDDPRGEVGIEFMVVTDGSADRPVSYQVPMTYRGAPLEGAEGLIGTTEHGVLGRRWVYDGVHDPVLVAQLLMLIQGAAEPQAQGLSHTPDPTVSNRPLTGEHLAMSGHTVAANGSEGSELHLTAAGERGTPVRGIIRVHRVPHVEDPAATAGAAAPAGVTATWRLPDGSQVRGAFATARLDP